MCCNKNYLIENSSFRSLQIGAMSKRGVEESGAAIVGQPPIKKVQFEPHLIGPVSTLEELDIKVLQFQNKKLAQVGLESLCPVKRRPPFGAVAKMLSFVWG